VNRAENGARHVGSGPLLGSQRDLENDGTHSLLASFDDLNPALDDEDGVVFTSALVPGQAATLEVTASAAGRLDAWFDADANGTWDHPGERFFNALNVAAGTRP